MPGEGNVLGGTHPPAIVVTSDKLFWNPTMNKEDMSQTWNLYIIFFKYKFIEVNIKKIMAPIIFAFEVTDGVSASIPVLRRAAIPGAVAATWVTM